MCAEQLLTVDELARKHGHFIPAKRRCRWLQDRYSWQHAAASERHGWRVHKHHAHEPMRLSDEDYLAAIGAVSGRAIRVHPGALSEHCPHDDEAARTAKAAKGAAQ